MMGILNYSSCSQLQSICEGTEEFKEREKTMEGTFDKVTIYQSTNNHK
jgi:hypothetical protein